MRNLLRDPVVLVTAAVVVVAVVIALVWATRSSGTGDGEPDREVGQDRTLEDVTELRELVGETVEADRAEVVGVPADEGFWVGTGDEPAWVELSTLGESRMQVDVGDRVSFTGEVVAHDADFADRDDLSTDDAAELAAAGAHVEVDPDDILVED